MRAERWRRSGLRRFGAAERSRDEHGEEPNPATRNVDPHDDAPSVELDRPALFEQHCEHLPRFDLRLDLGAATQERLEVRHRRGAVTDCRERKRDRVVRIPILWEALEGVTVIPSPRLSRRASEIPQRRG